MSQKGIQNNGRLAGAWSEDAAVVGADFDFLGVCDPYAHSAAGDVLELPVSNGPVLRARSAVPVSRQKRTATMVPLGGIARS